MSAHSKQECKCTCGTNAEPGVCEHKWDGPVDEGEMPGGGHYSTATCSRCGLSAMAHDMWLF